jgi:hypothetical protein
MATADGQWILASEVCAKQPGSGTDVHKLKRSVLGKVAAESMPPETVPEEVTWILNLLT